MREDKQSDSQKECRFSPNLILRNYYVIFFDSKALITRLDYAGDRHV